MKVGVHVILHDTHPFQISCPAIELPTELVDVDPVSTCQQKMDSLDFQPTRSFRPKQRDTENNADQQTRAIRFRHRCGSCSF